MAAKMTARGPSRTVEDVRATLLRQSRTLRAHYPGQLVLMRSGDFYLAFGEDAEVLANVAGAPRERWTQDVPAERGFPGYSVAVVVATIPYHALPTYLAKLTASGHRQVVAVEGVVTP